MGHKARQHQSSFEMEGGGEEDGDEESYGVPVCLIEV